MSSFLLRDGRTDVVGDVDVRFNEDALWNRRKRNGLNV